MEDDTKHRGDSLAWRLQNKKTHQNGWVVQRPTASAENEVRLFRGCGMKSSMDVKNLAHMEPFVTKDGSQIRELLAHRNSAIRHQSLAEARLAPGASTQEHYHLKTEEIYYITHGVGRIRIDGELCDVAVGDAIAILPGRRHKLWNIGAEELRLLCCCAPAYEHEDTVMTEGA
jgi:mannose-6-phosphate isomerase-like protein (cupin superfamily)